MTYSHSTNHSFNPKIDFWRPIENLFNSFPYWEQWNKYHSKNDFINFYETKTKESFDVYDDDEDIYGKKLIELYTPRGAHNILLKDIPKDQRKNVRVGTRINHTGKIIKFLSKHISNPDTLHKFQRFIECAYKFLVNIQNFDINNPIIRSHGLNDESDVNYVGRKGEFNKKYINNEKGIIKPDIFKDYFNSACRKHGVPFIMFIQNDECYVIHTTDIFVEKAILNTPVFLKNNSLKQANDYFVKAVTWRDKGDFKESLNNLRQAMEDIRDEIFKKYTLGNPSISLHNDLMKLIKDHKDKVFDFSKIPQSDPKELEKIITKLKESISLLVKMTNIGSHKSSDPTLIEGNTTLFALGLASTILPYLFYLLK